MKLRYFNQINLLFVPLLPMESVSSVPSEHLSVEEMVENGRVYHSTLVRFMLHSLSIRSISITVHVSGTPSFLERSSLPFFDSIPSHHTQFSGLRRRPV